MERRLDNSELFEFLEEIDNRLSEKIVLVAFGGTAMTLLNLKPTTRDVDFIVHEGYDHFKDVLDKTPHGFKVDYMQRGYAFSTILPEDYVKKSRKIKAMNNIDLRALDPLDIVVTKIGRLNERDIEDIKTCVEKCDLKRSAIEKRASQIEVAGNDESYRMNVRAALKMFFQEK